MPVKCCVALTFTYIFFWAQLLTVFVGFRYLCSLVETILIYQQFKKPGVEQPAPKQELVDFWMDFLVEATKKDVSSVRFPVGDFSSNAPKTSRQMLGKRKGIIQHACLFSRC